MAWDEVRVLINKANNLLNIPIQIPRMRMRKQYTLVLCTSMPP
jgi:hypothetical protein